MRSINEDCFAVGSGQPEAPPGLLFVVCDGRGGPHFGEVAAQLAADTIVATYYASNEPDPAEALREAFQTANQRIYHRWGHSTTRVTAVAALVIAEQLVIASAGDCRAYHFHNGQLQRITTDHTIYEELIQQGVLTRQDVQMYSSNITRLRALGESLELNVDVFQQDLPTNAALLLCTDGLHDYVEDQEIEETLTNTPWQDAADRFVDLIYSRGGRDNVTAILIWREEELHKG
jgi:serine/threonine protein phosphatase PrpC